MEVASLNNSFHSFFGFLDKFQPENNKSDEIKLDRKTAEETVDKLNKAFEQMQNQIQFALDEKSGRMVFYVKDGITGDVIRQVPDAGLLKISQQISEYLEDFQKNLNKNKDNKAQSDSRLSGLVANTSV